MKNLINDIIRIKKEIKADILCSIYKDAKMYVLNYKKYINYKEQEFFIAQPFFVGKINSRTLTINAKYENGFLYCDILINGIYKVGNFYFKYNEIEEFIGDFYFNLSHHIYKYINSEYYSISRICHYFNYKSRMKMIELKQENEKIDEYLMLCKERNWDCNYLGIKR